MNASNKTEASRRLRSTPPSAAITGTAGEFMAGSMLAEAFGRKTVAGFRELRGHGLLHGKQLLQRAAQVLQVKRVRAVRLRVLRVVVYFHKDAVHARRHGRAREYGDELRLPAAHCVFPVALR